MQKTKSSEWWYTAVKLNSLYLILKWLWTWMSLHFPLSVRYLKTCEREKKVEAWQLLIKATFCRQRNFLWVHDCYYIVNINPPHAAIGWSRSRDSHSTFSLASSSQLLMTVSINWTVSTQIQNWNLARGDFLIRGFIRSSGCLYTF